MARMLDGLGAGLAATIRVAIPIGLLALNGACSSAVDNSEVVDQGNDQGGVDSPRVAMSGSGRGLIAYQFRPGRGEFAVLGASYSIAEGLGAAVPSGGAYFVGYDGGELGMDSAGRGVIFETNLPTDCGDPTPGSERHAVRSRDHDPIAGWGPSQAVVEVVRNCDFNRLVFVGRDLAVDAAGNALAVWVEQGGDDLPSNLFAALRLAGGSWTAPIQVNEPLGPQGAVVNVEIAMNAAGAALALYRINPADRFGSGGPRLLFAHTFNFSAGFGPAVRLDVDSNVGAATIAIDGAGNGLAVWSDDNFLEIAPLRSRRFLAGAGWAATTAVIGEVHGFPLLRLGLDAVGNGMLLHPGVAPATDDEFDRLRDELWVLPFRNGEWLTTQRFVLASGGAGSGFALAVAPGGDATVMLTQRRGDEVFNNPVLSLAYRRFRDSDFAAGQPGTGWQPLTVVEGPVAQREAPNPDVAMESLDSGIAVWTSQIVPPDNTYTPSQIRAFIWAPPLAAIDAAVDAANVRLDASASRARTTGAGIVGYEWDFENDGVFDATGLRTQTTYPVPRTYTVRLRVTDDAGISAEITREVTTSAIGTPPPPPPTFVLNVTTTSGSGAGRVVSAPAGIDCGLGGEDCSETFDAGVVVTLAQTPGVGSRFDVWRGDADCSNANVTMNADKLCEAVFVTEGGGGTTFTLTILNVVGSGRVETADARIFCPGGACSASYAPGATVQVNAVPNADALLEDWAGDCNAFGALPTFMLTMDRDITCTATFASR